MTLHIIDRINRGDDFAVAMERAKDLGATNFAITPEMLERQKKWVQSQPIDELTEVMDNHGDPYKILNTRNNEYYDLIKLFKSDIISKAKNVIDSDFVTNNPLSIIVHSVQEDLPILVYKDTYIHQLFQKAEIYGVGYVRAEYSIEKDKFYIRVYFIHKNNKDLIKQSWITHDLASVTSEDIHNFWYGGRYAKNKDNYLVMYDQYGSGDATRGIQLMPNSPYSYTHTTGHYPSIKPYNSIESIFAQNATHTTYDTMLPKVGELIQQVEIAYHLKATKRITDEVTLPSDTSQLSLAVQQYDAKAKILESIVVLDQNSLDSNTTDTLKNRAALIDALHKLSTNSTSLHASKDNYVSINSTLSMYDTLQNAVLSNKNQSFPLLKFMLTRLQNVWQASKALQIQAPKSQECVSAEIMQQLEQKNKEIGELLTMQKSTQADVKDIKTQLAAMMALLAKREQKT